MRLMNVSKKKITYYAWAVWFVASLFYAIEFLQRVSPSVMALPLMQYFNIGPGKLSFIISLYFYAYALAQIPVGMMLDRFGARRLLTLACIVISFSSLLFALSQSLFILATARILIGFASAFAFLGVLKLSSAWFPENRYPLIVGLTNTLGVAGAILGEAPLAKLVQSYGWQQSMIILALIGFVISILIWFVIKDCPICLIPDQIRKKINLPRVPQKKIIKYLKKILTNQQIWLTAIYAGLMVAPVIALGELWAVPFISSQYHLSAVMSASINSAMFIGIALGGPINGLLAAYVKDMKWIMRFGNSMAFICLVFFIYDKHLAAVPLFILLLLFGFGTSSMLIVFTLNKSRFSPEYSATIAAFTNIIIVMSGSIFQDILGFLLHHFDSKSFLDYTAAFSIIPCVSFLCFILLFFIRSP